MESLIDRIERFQYKLEELSQEEPYKEKIGLLHCFKGIDTTVAMTLHVEISDFNRFPKAIAFMSYYGLIPGEDSSGYKANRTDITKQRNTVVRKTLEECTGVSKGSNRNKRKKCKSKTKRSRYKSNRLCR